MLVRGHGNDDLLIKYVVDFDEFYHANRKNEQDNPFEVIEDLIPETQVIKFSKIARNGKY